MRQIFIVNSSTDTRFESFFSKIFLTMGVQTVWEKYETIAKDTPAKDRIEKEIKASDALFFVLSTDAEFADRAKAWFPWVTNLAMDKDIWVFEHCEDLKRIPVLIPHLGNYVAYYISNAWSDYVTKIAEIYEKPKAVAASMPDVLWKSLTPAEESIFFNPSTGFALFDYSTARPTGFKALCPNCSSAYGLHVPAEMKVIRCPSCNHFYGILQPSKVPVPVPA